MSDGRLEGLEGKVHLSVIKHSKKQKRKRGKSKEASLQVMESDKQCCTVQYKRDEKGL